MWTISETRTRSSGILRTSTKKQNSCFGGAFMTFGPCGVDGSDNTKRSCKLSYATPTDASGRAPDVADAPRNMLTPAGPMVLYLCYMYNYCGLQSHRNRSSDRLGGLRP